ncbi:MAG TPA: hypothetical protein VHG35_08565 [Gemmatimonadales bacterium]|nr:hypothetical protein [Gemmatimonadales bacterium]
MHQAPKKAAASRPRLRKVPVEALTSLGWLNGTLHVPSHLALSEFLALGTQPLKLTEAQVPNETERLAFVALRRDAVVLVSPALADEGEGAEASAYTTDLAVACLLPMGILRGTLRVIYNLRLSDHLQQTGHLLSLHRCLLAPYGGTANSPGARGLHAAIVNLNHAVGISECD